MSAWSLSLPEMGGHGVAGADALYAAQGLQRPQVWSHVPGGIRHLPCSQQLVAFACAEIHMAMLLAFVVWATLRKAAQQDEISVCRSSCK